MIHHPTADIFIDEHDFIRMNIREGAEITLEDGHEYVKIFEQLCGGVPRCFIADVRGTYATASHDNRKYMSRHPEALKWRKADAILVDSLHHRLVANFFMRFAAPDHPVKVFNDEREALKWLNSF